MLELPVTSYQNVDAWMTQLITGQNADVGLTFSRSSVIPAFTYMYDL